MALDDYTSIAPAIGHCSLARVAAAARIVGGITTDADSSTDADSNVHPNTGNGAEAERAPRSDSFFQFFNSKFQLFHFSLLHLMEWMEFII